MDAVHVDEIGRYVVPAGGATIKVSFTVLNNGSEAGNDDELTVCLWSDCKTHVVKALAPGEKASGELQLGIGSQRVGDTDLVAETWRSTHRMPFRVERPDLTAHVEVEREVLAVSQARAIVRVRNNAYLASARPSVTELCLATTWDACLTNVDRLHVNTPELGGGEERTDTLDFPVPGSALDRVDSPIARKLLACANSTEVLDEADPRNNCYSADVMVLPNFDALCSAEPLAVGETRASTIRATDCEIDYTRSRLYRIDSPADGTTYMVKVDGQGFSRLDVRVINSRGTVVHHQSSWSGSLEFPFQVNAGTYYIAVGDFYDNTADFTITLTQ